MHHHENLLDDVFAIRIIRTEGGHPT
jgi:hypothetical protein